MSTPPPLSPLSDPGSLAKLQILLVPVQSPGSTLSEDTYEYWSSLIKRHTVVRGDELKRPAPTTHTAHTRGASGASGVGSVHPRSRFLPPSSSTSISRGGAPNHVHITYPTHPPARHLSNLSLLRLSAFPLVVIGVSAEGEHEAASSARGYDLSLGSDDDIGDDGDIGQASTPRVSTFGLTASSPSHAFSETISSLFPTTSPFPLVQKLLIVPPIPPSLPASPRASPARSAQSFNGGKRRDEANVVHAPTEGIESWVGRLLGDIISDVLGELGELATALETPTGLKTLSSTLLPSLTSTLPNAPPNSSFFPGQHTSSTPTNDLPEGSRSNTPISTIPHSHSVGELSYQSHSQSSMGISLTRALTPGGRPTSVGPPALPPIQSTAIAPSPNPTPPPASSNPFRRSTAITSPFNRSTSAASLASTTSASSTQATMMTGAKYTTAPLGGLAGGRLLKLLGDMYLLAGMYGDAIKCFDDGAERCRTVGDVLWEALAREGRAVAGIGEAWEGRDGSNMTQPFPTSPIPVEILSHFLSALACLSRAPLPYPPTILSPSPQAVSGSISFSAPSTTNPTAIGTGEGLLAYLHTGLALRISHFLLIIWSAGGWGSIALSAVLSNTLPRSFPIPLSTEENRDPSVRRKRRKALGYLGSNSLLSRQAIFSHAESALGPHHRAMTKSEQLNLHVEAVWLARWLDLPRKEACITREVIKRVAIMVAEGREETRRFNAGGFSSSKGNREPPPSSLSLPDSASVGLGLGMAVQTPSSHAVGVRRRESTEGNAGVIALFERALSLMGIDLLEEGTGNQASSDNDHSVPPHKFGWPELQVEMMKEGIAVAEALPDHLAIIRLCTSALNKLYTHLNGPSQAHVAKMFPSALATVRRRGLEFGSLPWWVPGKIVLSLELASLPPNRLPVEHSLQEIVPEAGKRDPFLYNPRLKSAEAGKTILVANESTDVFVTIQNPFAFELDIQDVSLITSGVTFTSNPLTLNLPADSVQTVRVTGFAAQSGSLQLRGVSLRLPDGSSTDIFLPLLNEKDRQKEDKRRSRLFADHAKIKRQGIEARWSSTAPEPSVDSAGEARWLECKVVDEQPLAWIKKTSLTHGTVMLYDGETSTIRITLENSSSIPVDFIKLSFDDSASRYIQAVLAEGEVSPEQAYELEYDMIKRPIFTWDGDGEVSILPGGRSTITVTCLGKVGCTDGTITIDYGYVHRDTNGDRPTTFQTRQIVFPVLFTVYHTLDPHSLDIVRMIPSSPADENDSAEVSEKSNGFLPVPTNYDGGGPSFSRRASGSLTPRTPGFTVGEAFKGQKLREEMDNHHCLIGVSVRNVYGVPFEVTIQRIGTAESLQDTGDDVSTTRLVPPGATERLILPVPRLSLRSEELTAPIPSLSDRQYVVDKTEKTPEQVKLEREIFWYREELLKMVTATWIEPGSRRTGTMSLRDQILSPSLLEVLRLDDLELTLEAVPTAEGNRLEPTEPVDVVLTLTNQLARPIRPFVRIEPLPSSNLDNSWAQSPSSASSASRQNRQSINPNNPQSIRNTNIVFDGSLSSPLDLLAPGAEAKYVVRAIFLATGTFAFRAVVEEIDLEKREKEPKVRFAPLLNVRVG